MIIEQHQEIGRREEQQDRILKIEAPHGFLIAVADGHGLEGAAVADAAIRAVKEMGIPSLLTPFEPWMEDVHRVIVAQTRRFSKSGSTLSIFYNVWGQSFIYQIGDSPIFVKKGNSIQEFKGHGVDFLENSDDVARAVNAGGKINGISGYNYLTYWNHALRLTRALGNSFFDEIVSQEPLVQKIDGVVDAVLVASDGFTGEKNEVFDKMKKQQDLAEFVKGQKSRGVGDNLSMNLTYLF